ncbi:TetR family transcriptional regulator [Aneurinibacillus danicus]|uniref:TetR family transcriptional regulator n=2 Tax=Aneurinibacillus danicus TaxID=267746 RepID=A0A511VER5_9BACL|nr:TetR family transcriptional regulator [Aneurinibacillus danicus]
MMKKSYAKLEPRTQRGMKTKQKLLDAAEIVFGEKGFHQASIVDITQQAKVSMGTFYTYFESKEDIFRELVMSMQKNMRKAIKIGTQGITDRIELEREGFRIFFQFLQKHRYLYRLFRQAEFVDVELHRSYFETFSRGYISGLQDSMEKGEIRAYNPELLAYCFMGIMDYVGMKWVLWEQQEVTDEFIDELVCFIKNGIGKP